MLLLPINIQLTNLQSWQQSVFCMALAERTILHFHLFCEAIDSNDGETINNINQLFWEKMTTKGAKINFEIQQERFEEIIPDAREYDFYGIYPAVDHCVIMSCVFNSLLSNSKEEALNASQTSFATIASFIELQKEQEIDEQQLMEEPLFQEELQFQKTVLKKLGSQRSPELIKSIRKLVSELATTSLGITLES